MADATAMAELAKVVGSPDRRAALNTATTPAAVLGSLGGACKDQPKTDDEAEGLASRAPCAPHQATFTLAALSGRSSPKAR